MLYSENIKLNGKNYALKVGLRELILLEDANINLSQDLKMKDLAVAYQIVLGRTDENITLDQTLDLLDNSEYPLEEIFNKLKRAIDLGINKKNAAKEEKTPKLKNA